MAPDATLFDPFSPSGSTFSMATLIRRADDPSPGAKAQYSEGIGIVSFLTAIGVALAVFAAQFMLFVLLRNKLARILYVSARLRACSLFTHPRRHQQTENIPGS